MSEASLRALLAAGGPREVVGDDLFSVRALGGSGGGRAIFEVEASGGTFIARLASGERGAADLQKERRLAELLRFLPLEVPRLSLHPAPGGSTLSLHRKIEGVSFDPRRVSPRDQEAFVRDVAGVLFSMHTVSWAEACDALGLAPLSKEQAAEGASWFDAARIGAAVEPQLERDPALRERWDEVCGFFARYEVDPEDMVLGHGDLHGGNMALAETPAGLRLHGIFDLQIGGLVHLYDEFLRILLLGTAPGRRIVARYNELSGRDRVRAEVLEPFYRAFVFYLLPLRPPGGPADDLLALLAEEAPAGVSPKSRK